MGIFSRRKKKEPAPKAPVRPPPPRAAPAAPARNSAPSAVPAKSRVDNVTQEIKNRRDHIKLLEKNRSYKQKQIEDEVKKALALRAKGDKNGAIMCMKRKKRYESAMETISTQIETIEQVIDTMEAQIRNAEVVEGIKSSNVYMKEQGVDVNKADEVLENMKDTMDEVQDVNNAFKQTTLGEQYDEDDLMAELELEEQKKVPDTSTALPDVPTTVPKVSAAPQESEEEKELRELERSMAATTT